MKPKPKAGGDFSSNLQINHRAGLSPRSFSEGRNTVTCRFELNCEEATPPVHRKPGTNVASELGGRSVPVPSSIFPRKQMT